MNLSIVTDGFMQGTLQQTEEGREVNVLLQLTQSEAFYDYFLEQFKR
jgi:hypothetical protein